jgi:ABC-type phosphate transport system substrate-binding protein
MKTKTVFYKILLSVIIFLFPSGFLFAQEIYIEGTKFIRPIVEKWISEYKKENPNSTIQLNPDPTEDEKSSGLSIVAHSSPVGEVENNPVVYLGRYALLPISNTNNPLLEKVAKGLNKKDLVNLVFEKDILSDDFDPDEKTKYIATVYTRGNKSSTSIALANFFDQSHERIRGKKILGDELYLLNAVQKDETGITFNTLNYVFDLKSRQLKSEISIVPLHLKNKQKEALDSHNIDKVISLLEETKIETIPVENFGLKISEAYLNNKELANFINWILSNGQKFNHEYGFLNLDEEIIASQKTLLESTYKKYLSYSKNN